MRDRQFQLVQVLRLLSHGMTDVLVPVEEFRIAIQSMGCLGSFLENQGYFLVDFVGSSAWVPMKAVLFARLSPNYDLQRDS